MLSSGLSNGQIAQARDLVEGAAKNHVSVVVGKLVVCSPAAAALLATRAGPRTTSRAGGSFVSGEYWSHCSKVAI